MTCVQYSKLKAMAVPDVFVRLKDKSRVVKYFKDFKEEIKLKNRRFVAALLTATMILTSQSFSVAAYAQEGLADANDTVISCETEQVSEPLAIDEETLVIDAEELAVDEDTLTEEVLDDSEIISFGDDGFMDAAEGTQEGEPGPGFDEDEYEQPEGDYTDVLSINIINGKRVLGLVDPTKKLADLNITTVYIPENVDLIPKSEYLFEGNKTTKNILFGSPQTKDLSGNDISPTLSTNMVIESEAFKNSGVVSFVAPGNYFTIENGTFNSCVNLSSFDFKNISSIGNSAFDGCENFGDGQISWYKKIISIGMYAFRNTGFVNLNMSSMIAESPKDVTIGNSAFSACKKLKTISIPENVEVIPEYCFAGCSLLTEIQVNAHPAGTEIKSFAFQNCIGLTTLGTDDKYKKTNNFNVEEIGVSAFSGCTGLTKLYFPPSVKKVDANAFESCGSIVLIEFWRNTNGEAVDVIIHDMAFPDPIPSKATMKGFDGMVKAFALKAGHVFKEFVTLAEAHTITAQDKDGKAGGFGAGKTIKTNKSGDKAIAGTEIEMTVTPRSTDPASAWRLRRDSLYDVNNKLTVDDFKFEKGDDKSQTFKFIMPYSDVIVNAQNGFYQDSWIKNGTHTGLMGVYKNEGVKFVEDGGTWYTQHPGCWGQVYVNAKVDSGNHKGDYKLGQWMFEYKSSNEKVATVTANGEVNCIAPGDVKITATYRGDNAWKVEIPINVGPAVDLDVLSVNAVNISAEFTSEWKTKRINEEEYNVQVLTIDKEKLISEGKTLDLQLEARQKGKSESYTVNASWSISDEDTSVAKLEKATTLDNKNKLTIKKGANGTAGIKVTYNTHRKENDKDIILTAYLIVNVLDITPRTTVEEIVVNTNRDAGWDTPHGTIIEGGTPITLTAAEGYTIDESITAVMRLRKGPSRNNTSEYNGLKIKKTIDGYCLVFNHDGSDSGLGADTSVGKSKSYSGKNQLWISGKYTDGTEFMVPLSKVTIKNEPLKLAAKITGSINLWYKQICYRPVNNDETLNIINCYDELARKDGETVAEYNERYESATVGRVKAENNILYDTAEVVGCALWDADHYKLWKNGTSKDKFNDDGTIIAGKYTDKLANNFVIGLDPRDGTQEKDFEIFRSGNDLSPNGVDVKDNKEYDVTKGYLAVYFKGYSKPVLQGITIPTKTTAPSYVLSETSITENEKNTAGKFRFKIMDKDRKKVMVSGNTALRANSIDVDKTQGTDFASAVFDGEDVLLTASEGLRSGKKTAVIKVRKDNWEKTAQYKYTVNYVDKIPTAKLKTSTLKTNIWYKNAAVETELTLNQANCTLTVKDNKFVYSGSDKLSGDQDKINISVNKVVNYKNKLTIIAKFKDPSRLPEKGTYKFTFTPQYQWGTGATYDLKPMTLNVSVQDKQPTVKLNATTYTFNMYYPDMETKEVVATFGNLPTGREVKDLNIDTSNAKFEFVKSSKDADIKDAVANGLKDNVTVKYDKDKKRWMMYFKMNAPTLKNRDFNITYDLTDIYLDNTKIKPIRVTIKGINKEPTVSTSASGTLNVIDYTSTIKYTVKFKNLVNPALKDGDAGIEVWSVSNNKVSDYLVAKQDKDKPNVVNVTIQEGKRLSNVDYKNYAFRLKFVVKNGDRTLDIISKTIKLKPVQKTPKINTKIGRNWAKKAIFYDGVKDDDRKVKVYLTKTSQIKTHITKIKLADSNSTLLKEAFEVTQADYEYPWINNVSQEDTLAKAVARYNSLAKNVKRLDGGAVTIHYTNPGRLKPGKTYTLVLEAEFDGQFYKTDKYGNLVLDSKGQPIKINGSTFKVPIVVYN